MLEISDASDEAGNLGMLEDSDATAPYAPTAEVASWEVIIEAEVTSTIAALPVKSSQDLLSGVHGASAKQGP